MRASVRASSAMRPLGLGTVSSLAMQSIRSAFKLDITPVPFAGGAQVTMAVMGRHVDIGMVPFSTGAELLREGKLRPLLTTAATRLRQLPDTPTLSEKGLPTKGIQPGARTLCPKGDAAGRHGGCWSTRWRAR